MGRRSLVVMTNDDGYNSTGLLAAWQALKDQADTLIGAEYYVARLETSHTPTARHPPKQAIR